MCGIVILIVRRDNNPSSWISCWRRWSILSVSTVVEEVTVGSQPSLSLVCRHPSGHLVVAVIPAQDVQCLTKAQLEGGHLPHLPEWTAIRSVLQVRLTTEESIRETG